MLPRRINQIASLGAAMVIFSLVAGGPVSAQKTKETGSWCFATAYRYSAWVAKRYVSSCSVLLARDDTKSNSQAEAHAIRARAYNFLKRYAEAAADYAAAARMFVKTDASRAAMHRRLRNVALAKVPRTEN